MSKEKSTVEIIKNIMEVSAKNGDLPNDPQAMQAIHLSTIVILLAALDDDLKQLIHVLEEKNIKAESEDEIRAKTGVWCNTCEYKHLESECLGCAKYDEYDNLIGFRHYKRENKEEKK